jgi:threonine synthase
MASNKPFIYRCSICNECYDPVDIIYTCKKDGGNLDILLNFDLIKQQYGDHFIQKNEPSLWRYLHLLPVSDPGCWFTPLRMVGWTPMYFSARLSNELGIKHLWIKDESRNPTASFKDRASSVLVARAREIHADVIVTASTGNAGAALAGMGAAVDHNTVIFAPRTAPPAKIAQLLVYGSHVFLVDGNYDAAVDLAKEASDEFGWYCRNTGYNPFTIEGKKTAAFEIWEFLFQNSDSISQDQVSKISDLSEAIRKRGFSVFVSVGDGNIISGIHKGFKDLREIGLLEQMPRIYGIQSEGSAAIANAFKSGTEEITPVVATTRADSISVNMPSDGVRAVRASTQTGGAYLTVTDEEILQAIVDLGKVGIFSEPAGSASYAGLKAAVRDGYINPEDPVVVINTGSGLKDVSAASQSTGEAPIIEPTMDAVRKIVKQRLLQ